jgi:hypothetical protein
VEVPHKKTPDPVQDRAFFFQGNSGEGDAEAVFKRDKKFVRLPGKVDQRPFF